MVLLKGTYFSLHLNNFVRPYGCKYAISRLTKLLHLTLYRLMSCDKDAPLVLLYSVADSKEALKSTTPPKRSLSEPIVCVLEGSIGVDQEHELAPSRFILSDQTWLSPHFQKALDQLSPVVLPGEGKTKDLMDGLGKHFKTNVGLRG
jgi:hypothetical protein